MDREGIQIIILRKPPAIPARLEKPMPCQAVIQIAKNNRLLPRKLSNKAVKRVPMKDRQSLAHTNWECKNHIVIVPKQNI
jgi:hypothetical protein